jgi:hypothetical protein
VLAADELIALVRGVPEIGGGRGDTSGLFMHGAYGHGFRRFVASRNLAHDGSAEDAAILTRSLVNILVRACWIDEPRDKAERKDRFNRLLRRQYEDDLNELELQGVAGFLIDPAARAEAQDALDQLSAAGVKGMPSERQLFETLELGGVYARIYAPASNQMHFSMDVAIRDLLEVEEIALERRKYPEAGETLILALIAFSILLEKSERSVQHGLTAAAVDVGDRLMRELPPAV